MRSEEATVKEKKILRGEECRLFIVCLTKIRPPCPVNLKLQDCWTPVDGSHHSAVKMPPKEVVIYSGSCLYFRTCSCPVFLLEALSVSVPKARSLASQLFYCGMQHQPQHVNLFHTLYSLRQKKVTSALFVSFFKLLQI